MYIMVTPENPLPPLPKLTGLSKGFAGGDVQLDMGGKPGGPADTYDVLASPVHAPVATADTLTLDSPTAAERRAEPLIIKSAGEVAVGNVTQGAQTKEQTESESVDAGVAGKVSPSTGKELALIQPDAFSPKPASVEEGEIFDAELVSDKEYGKVLKRRAENEKLRELEEWRAAQRKRYNQEYPAAHSRAQQEALFSIDPDALQAWQQFGLFPAGKPIDRAKREIFDAALTPRTDEERLLSARVRAAKNILITTKVRMPVGHNKIAYTNKLIIGNMNDEIREGTDKGVQLTKDLSGLLSTYERWTREEKQKQGKGWGMDERQTNTWFMKEYAKFVEHSMQNPEKTVEDRIGVERRAALLTFLWHATQGNLPFERNKYLVPAIRKLDEKLQKTA
jgi:hypothetical protein